MSSFYVATATANIDNAEWWIDQIQKYGHTITFDWTPMVREYGRGEPGATATEVLKQAAEADFAGACTCDVLFFLWHPEVYGALIEFGLALRAGTPIWVVGPLPTVKYSIFFAMPEVKQYTPREARDALQTLSDEDKAAQAEKPSR